MDNIKNNFKILIVDDQQGMCWTLIDILEDKGFSVDSAENGFIAIEKNKKKGFDIIIMDVIMPGKNGVETLKEIKLINPRVTVILMTAYTAQDLIIEAQKEGIYACLPKPFKPDRLIKMIYKIKQEKRQTLSKKNEEKLKAKQKVEKNKKDII